MPLFIMLLIPLLVLLLIPLINPLHIKVPSNPHNFILDICP